jgi:macrolide phosphotransferase
VVPLPVTPEPVTPVSQLPAVHVTPIPAGDHTAPGGHSAPGDHTPVDDSAREETRTESPSADDTSTAAITIVNVKKH